MPTADAAAVLIKGMRIVQHLMGGLDRPMSSIGFQNFFCGCLILMLRGDAIHDLDTIWIFPLGVLDVSLNHKYRLYMWEFNLFIQPIGYPDLALRDAPMIFLQRLFEIRLLKLTLLLIPDLDILEQTGLVALD